MPDREPFKPHLFWQFSLGHYARAGVRAACLSLQDNYRGNINLALLLHWLDDLHYHIPEHCIPTLEAALSDTDRLLGQYRVMRRQLKSQLDSNGYQSLLQFELEIEKQQQQALIARINHRCDLSLPVQTAPGNLQRYCHRLGATALLPALQGREQCPQPSKK